MLYMDLYNNEIVSYGLSTKRGDTKTYYGGLEELITKKKHTKTLRQFCTLIKVQFTLQKATMN